MKRLKVAIVAISLKNGGLERSCANLSKLLTRMGLEVHIICLNPDVDYEYEGHLFVVKDKTTTKVSRFIKFFRFKQYLKENRFDYIIDNRIRKNTVIELLYLFYMYRSVKIVYMVHNSRLNNYFTRSNWIAKQIIKCSYVIVTVSNGIKKKIELKYKTDKCLTIYNGILKMVGKSEQGIVLKEDYVLFLGRIDNAHKNMLLLLRTYKKADIFPDKKLYIVGSGNDEEMVKREIEILGLSEHVRLLGYRPYVTDYILNADFLVLTSRREGFPMVLIESLSLGTPVVSVDCPFGPSEIVQHEKNGLLVENYNEEALANAMRRMVFDRELYARCKKNAKSSVKHLSFENISKKWFELLRK